MTYKGHIRNHTLVLNEPVQLPEGSEVTVEVRIQPDSPLAGPDLFVDPWTAIEKEINALQYGHAALIAQELTPPTTAAILCVAPLIAKLRKQNFNAASRTVPDGDGGILLEWIDPIRREIVRTVQIAADGAVEMAEFTDNRLQSRRQIN